MVRRRTDFELRKAREREHLLLGFQKALDHLDEVIRLIRASKNPKEARETLIATFEFTERQAQAIIEMQLQRLTGMERQKILDKLAELQRRIARYLEILGSDSELRDVVVEELEAVRKEYADGAVPRLSKTPERFASKISSPSRTSPSRLRAAGT